MTITSTTTLDLDYPDFLRQKVGAARSYGKTIDPVYISARLFDFQRAIVRWATAKGRAAAFPDTGLGKTLIQLEWARLLDERTLILAPLSVARQTVRMGRDNLDCDVRYVRHQSDISSDHKLWITNYEMLDAFELSRFGAVVLDESSILKALAGKTRRRLTDACQAIPYRLCCSATPAPNDYIELGNHAEFLGICSTAEMLSMFFVNANRQRAIVGTDGRIYEQKGSNRGGQEWRLKHHAETQFFEWLASWAISMTTPSDLGYSDDGFILPPLNVTPTFVRTDAKTDGRLFFTGLSGLGNRAEVRRNTVWQRLAECVRIVTDSWNDGHTKSNANTASNYENIDASLTNRAASVQSAGLLTTNSSEGSVSTTATPTGKSGDCSAMPVTMGSELLPMIPSGFGLPPNTSLASLDKWVIWCGLDTEQELVTKAFGPLCVSISGNLPIDEKVRLEELWREGPIPVMVTKAKIFGFGVNWQCAHHQMFFGLNDSWETYYQCIRRQWRYGQTKPVNVHIILAEAEDAIYHNVMRKEMLATRLRTQLIAAVRDYERSELGMAMPLAQPYHETEATGQGWRLMLGDSCQRLKEIATASVDLSVYSPPFADLYTYSASERDLGNCHDWLQFFEHYQYIVREVLRVTKPGRMTCVHTSDIPAMQSRDGWIGVKDFPGEVIRAYESAGWTFCGRAFIPKNPQAQAIRTHSQALLFVQLRKDSTKCRPALIDQVLLFKKPGDNVAPVNPVVNGEIDNDTWIEWANGIWLGISESDTLNAHSARATEDEKHICPLQLGTIERCIKLYSNPGEIVLTPFCGIGSEAYQAVRFGRHAIGIELKPSYFQSACANMRDAEALFCRQDMFEWASR